jgi:hypothetical protein
MSKLYSLFLCCILSSMLVSAQGFQMVGSTSVIPNTTQCFQLTPPNVYHQAGAVWATTPVDLNKSFVVNANLYFGSQDNGADGIAFVIQNAGLNAIGIDGGGLGYHGIPGNSFIVEFDTYQNLQPWWFTGDPVEDHIGFMSQGNAFHNSSTALLPPIPLAQNIEDGVYHSAIFSWNAATKTMTVSFLGQNYTYTGDIVNTIFGGNSVAYWGFTAGTGSDISLSGATQAEQRVCIPPPSCGQLRTQTPGGWGAKPSGNNPGTYLHQNFSSAFPNGLVVGDLGSGKYAQFTTAQAITDYLPAGGQARVLTTSYINPATNDLKNVLVNHLVALTLSVGFDAYDPSFGDAGVQLGDMIIKDGVFAGKSVSFFLSEANKVLAGLSNAYTLQQLVDVASAINENYDDGLIDNGYLTCPITQPLITQSSVKAYGIQFGSLNTAMNAWPNPSKGQFVIGSGGLQGNVRIQVLSSNGLVIQDKNIQVSSLGQTIHLDLTRFPQGMYMIRLSAGRIQQTQKILIQK